MPRRGSISKRDVLPDPLYNSKLVTKLINNVMYDGKKGVAQMCNSFFASLKLIKKRRIYISYLIYRDNHSGRKENDSFVKLYPNEYSRCCNIGSALFP